MSNLTDEIVQADQALRDAEERATEASRRMRQCKRELRDCREELSRLILELKTGESRHPLLERFGPGGERLLPNGQPLEHTHDEHQRGPTAFPEGKTIDVSNLPKPARAKRKAK
jgi:chromosome segregation ATPase